MKKILHNWFDKTNDKKAHKTFVLNIQSIIGQKIKNHNIYKLAIIHASAAKESHSGIKNSYERLEYLGDAMLGAIIAEYLFKKYPFKDEGFLTDIRSRIVNRESLNNAGKKLGLPKIVEYTGNVNVPYKSLYGDVLEALVGAVYLDKGFKSCKKFVLEKIIEQNFNIEQLIHNTTNFKSLLIEWSQKNNKPIRFEIIQETGSTHNKEFTAAVMLGNEIIGTGTGSSKKKSEQQAAQRACEKIGLI
ncbi:MAG: ribonuclease III [Cytophagaceae bacterium]|nr:ribonuclease III [Cytophagaceae bacterium]MDW8456755.1 ribonuclease III [Cytophagaceae bacterium]